MLRTTPPGSHTVHLENMASRLTASEVVQLLEDYDFSLEEEDDSDFEGDEVESYLPQALPGLANTEPLAQSSQEDEEHMEMEEIAEVEDSRNHRPTRQS